MTGIYNFMIEITLKKRKFLTLPDEFKPLIEQYKQYESDERIVLDVPRSWVGFKDGTVISMLKAFGEGIYVALAYISNGNEIVVDLAGNPVDTREIVIDGLRRTKHVKKKIRVIDIVDKEKKVFEVTDYVLNLDYLQPIVKVMHLYCAGSECRFNIQDFVKDEVRTNI